MSSQELSKFIYIEGGRNLPTGGFMRNDFMKITEVAQYRQKHNNKGLYLSAYIYDGLDPKAATLYADFYLDFDDEDNFETVRKDALFAIWYLEQKFKYNIPKSLIRIYYSGKKGVHIVVPAVIFGYEPHANLNEYFKIMAKDVAEKAPYDSIDMQIYDRRRLFRMVNSIHQDTGLFKIPLTYNELVNFKIEDIREIAKHPRSLQYPKAYHIAGAQKEFERHVEAWGHRFKDSFDKRKRHQSKPLDFVPYCVQELIDAGPQRGKRNDTASVLAAFWKKQGATEEEAWGFLEKWNNGSMPEREIREILKKMYSNSYEYGCSKLESLATCVGDKCPLYKKEKR